MKLPPHRHIVRLLIIPRGKLFALRQTFRLLPVLAWSYFAVEGPMTSQQTVPELPFTHSCSTTANVIPRSRPFSNAARCPQLRFSCFINVLFFIAVSTSSIHAPGETFSQFYASCLPPPLPSPGYPLPPHRLRWRCQHLAWSSCPSRPDPRQSPHLRGTHSGTATHQHFLAPQTPSIPPSKMVRAPYSRRSPRRSREAMKSVCLNSWNSS